MGERAMLGARRCPYCHDDLHGCERVWRCTRCETIHHSVCFAEGRACTVLGCGPPATTRRFWWRRGTDVSRAEVLVALGAATGATALAVIAAIWGSGLAERRAARGRAFFPIVATLAPARVEPVPVRASSGPVVGEVDEGD